MDFLLGESYPKAIKICLIVSDHKKSIIFYSIQKFYDSFFFEIKFSSDFLLRESYHPKATQICL